MTTIEIDGTEPRAQRLLETVSSSGHFTAMQVRGGKVRGVALHMQRLEAANRELFGADLDPDRVRALIRHALRDVKDASVRVFLYEGSSQPVTMVTVKQPAEIATPQGLMSVRYQRPDAHIKHVATDQGHYRRLAHRMGFDDALLTGDAGVVSETSMTNIGFFVDEGVVWPDAPMLHGITIRRHGLATRAGASFGCRVVRRSVPHQRSRARSGRSGRRSTHPGPGGDDGTHRCLRVVAVGTHLGTDRNLLKRKIEAYRRTREEFDRVLS